MARHRSAPIVLALIGLSAIALSSSHAHTAMTIAVDSNLLVFDGKVLFAQGTGSLTLLDLATGKVLLRKPPPHEWDFGGKLFKHKQGILMSDYSRTALLDDNTLEVIWSLEKTCDAAIGKDHFISHDGYHTVTCLEIATGNSVWITTMQGGWRLLASDDLVVVGTPHMYDEGHAVKLLELDSGEELFHRQANEDEQFLNFYFDGESVYLMKSKKEGREPDIDPVPEQLEVIGLDGQSLRIIDFQSDDILGQYGYKTPNHGFFLEGRYYSSDGSVRNAYPHEPDRWATEWSKEEALTETIPSGVLIERTLEDAANETGNALQLVSEAASWNGYVSYYDDARWLGRYTEAEGQLIFASGRGHVECIEIATGQPQWIYVFPVIRRTMSYSRYGMPPMLTERAAAYRNGLKNLGVKSGTLRIPDGEALSSINFKRLRDATEYTGTIIVDPAPDDPFADYVPRLVYRAAAFAALPVLIICCFVAIRIRRRKSSIGHDDSGPALLQNDFRFISGVALPMGVFAYVGIMLYGRVDPTITKCLWSVLGLAVFTCFYAAYKSQKLQEKS